MQVARARILFFISTRSKNTEKQSFCKIFLLNLQSNKNDDIVYREKQMDNILNKTYKLSIRQNPDGFSLSIYDENQLVLSTKNISINYDTLTEEELTQRLKTLAETDINYREVKFIVTNNSYITIPDALFDSESYPELIKFQHPDFDTKNNTLFCTSINRFQVNVIFSCPVKIANAIKNTFGEVSFSNSVTELLNSAGANNRNGINIMKNGKNKLEVVVVSNTGLQLANTFNVLTNEDILYHTLNVAELLRLTDDNRHITIFSENEEPELQSLIAKHLPDTVLIKTNI